MMNQNKLYRTKTYLAGNLEFTDDWSNWRDFLTASLSKLGIICLDPTKPCFLNQVFESKKDQAQIKEWRDSGDIQRVKTAMVDIIRKDLRMIDVTDFVIFYFQPSKPTFGTIHEFVHAVQQRKPVLILINDKKTLPLWICGLIDPDLVFTKAEDLVSYLTGVDSGEIEVDSKFWKLFSPDYR